MNQLPPPQATAAPVTRPATVTVACVLFGVAGLSLLVQAAFVGSYREWMLRLVERQLELMNVPEYAREAATGSVTSSLVQTAVSLLIAAALWIVIAVFAYRGRSWARVVAIVFGVFAAITGPLALLFTFALAPPPAVYLVTGVPCLIAVLAGTVLVWRRPAKDWYATMRPEAVPPR